MGGPKGQTTPSVGEREHADKRDWHEAGAYGRGGSSEGERGGEYVPQADEPVAIQSDEGLA